MDNPIGKPGRRQKRSRFAGVRFLVTLTITLIVIAAGLGVVVVVQHDFDVVEHRVSFTAGGNRLSGILATPSQGHRPFGLVVIVHGDGPQTAGGEQSGISYYRPIWEAFAQAGYASLSWDKPGVGGSSGTWLHQRMSDRAKEAIDAVNWARGRNDIDGHRIGLFGGSQAGWVLPKIAASVREVKWLIAVSPAINWQRQGRYLLLAGLQDREAAEPEIANALRRARLTDELIDRDASHQEYRAALGTDATMSSDRWLFAKLNHDADATEDLRALRAAGTRTLLVLGGHDRNVDVADTELTYRQTLAMAQLRVEHCPEADHGMLRYHLMRSAVKSTLTAVFVPRSLFAPGFLAALRAFAAR